MHGIRSVRGAAAAAALAALPAAGSCGGEGDPGGAAPGPGPGEPALGELARALPGGRARIGSLRRGFARNPAGAIETNPAAATGLEVWISAEFADDGSGAVRYRYRRSPRLWIELRPAGDAPETRIDPVGPALVGSRGGATRLLLASSRGVEEFWRVPGPDAFPPREYALVLGEGLAGVSADPGAGGLVAYDADGEPRFEIRHPVAFDAAGSRREARWTLAPDGPARRYAISAGFAADGLVFPVVVDPTVNVPSWIKRNPGAVPEKLVGAAMAFDVTRSRAVIFGGATDPSTTRNATWEWDGATWDNVTPSGAGPSHRAGASFVFDPAADRSVLQGGAVCGTADANTTWGWDGGSWAALPNANQPPCYRNYGGQTYDPGRGRVVLAGDTYADTGAYEYRAGSGWALLAPSTRPPTRGGNVLFFDPALKRSILFGGNNGLNDTWGWNGTNWVQYAPAFPPGPRQGLHAATDTDRNVGVVYGGVSYDGSSAIPETYEWSSQEWTYVPASVHPTAAAYGSMAYDSARKEVVFFGGRLPGAWPYYNETWVYKVLQYKTDGEPCGQSSECLHGHCADGVCCDSACGGGAGTDCQACSVAKGAAADGSCGPVLASAGVVCRPAAGPCDAAEACGGSSASCPPDAFLPATAACRPAAGPCDRREDCTGAAAQCPADGVSPKGTACRPAAGPCDEAEACDGAGAACPADSLKAQGAACRPADGPCDAEEACSGSSADCPPDAPRAAGSQCRPAAGPCDLPEACDGAGKACPPDSVRAAGAGCRPAAGDCDAAEACDGASPSCPADAKLPAGTACRQAAGECDSPEACDGASASCPPDAFLPASAECRAKAGPCDAAERCDGAGPSCPPDAREADGVPCDDGDACTAGDSCQSGGCKAGAAAQCDDGDPCTDDSCDQAAGCVHAPGPGCPDAGGDAGAAGSGAAGGSSGSGGGGASGPAGAGGQPEGGAGAAGGSGGASGGSSGSGAAGAAGGAPSQGGSAGAGDGADADASAGPVGESTTSGCGCRSARQGFGAQTAAALAAVLASVARARRRARRGAERPRAKLERTGPAEGRTPDERKPDEK